MIPVKPQPEPVEFEQAVRRPGLAWLRKHKINLRQPPPDASMLPPHWRKIQKPLWDAYGGICSYLCLYFEWPLGASSVDHFVAKSRDAGAAYEWLNYRLSCLGMNRNKNRFDNILDPFEIQSDTFLLNLASGEIRPNPNLPPGVAAKAEDTITRLGLNDPECMKMRTDQYTDLLRQDVSPSWLERKSPFVSYEAKRQGLL
ncbi:MAG: hypothetical protein HY674_01300 [Chloroflexi bacterium]|nr:hypothetical protein [Chloroflexota bacterium]